MWILKAPWISELKLSLYIFLLPCISNVIYVYCLCLKDTITCIWMLWFFNTWRHVYNPEKEPLEEIWRPKIFVYLDEKSSVSGLQKKDRSYWVNQTVVLFFKTNILYFTGFFVRICIFQDLQTIPMNNSKLNIFHKFCKKKLFWKIF